MNQSISLTHAPVAKGARITGLVIYIIVILFLLFDAIPKILVLDFVVKASEPFGLTTGNLRAIGTVLLICTVLYMIPQTRVLGAVLLTAYLGGAVMAMVMMKAPGIPYLFPIVFGILVWAPVYLQSKAVQQLLPVVKVK